MNNMRLRPCIVKIGAETENVGDINGKRSVETIREAQVFE